MSETSANFHGVPVDEWPIEVDERVLIFVVHENAQYCKTEEERDKWEGWCLGYWTNFNKGGWVWNGHIGRVTHVAPLPEKPPRTLSPAPTKSRKATPGNTSSEDQPAIPAVNNAWEVEG